MNAISSDVIRLNHIARRADIEQAQEGASNVPTLCGETDTIDNVPRTSPCLRCVRELAAISGTERAHAAEMT